MARQVHLRSRAAADIEAAITHFRGDAGDAVALAFVDALQHGIDQLARSPNAGSLRFAFELGIPEVRALRLRRFPHVIFYIPLADRIEVWRVLHSRRDIPATFARQD